MHIRRLVFLAVSLVPPLSRATETDPAASLARQRAQAALETRSSPRAAGSLVMLHSLREEVEDLNLMARTYQELLQSSATDPFVKTTARLLYADIERARGRLRKSAELLEPLHFIKDFYVVGSFDNEGKSGCDTAYGPETNLDLKAVYPSKWRETTWRKLEARSADGYVDLSAVLRPNREAVGYALTFLQAPASTRAVLSLGTSGAFRLWINGELAASGNQYHGARPEQNRVAVSLNRGTNRILLKVCQDTGGFGFYFRPETAGLRAVLPENLPPLMAHGKLAPKSLPTIASSLEAEVAKHPNDASLRANYASVLNYFRTFNEPEHLDVVEAQRAADAAPSEVAVQLLAAQFQDDDQNLRRKYLDAALKASPHAAEARFAMAQFEILRGYPERALPVLEALTSECPRLGAARVVLARAYELLGEWPRAVAVMQQAFDQLPRLPQLAREGARLSQRFDRSAEAIERYRLALALRFDDGQARRSLINLLLDLARVDEAASEMEVLLALDPFDNNSRLHLAELDASNGRVEEAQKLFAIAKGISPDEPDVYEKEGRALLSAGLREKALAAFDHSLLLRPQNPALKEAIRSLKGENVSFGSQYAVDVRPLAQKVKDNVTDDVVTLADLTYVRVQPSGLSSRFHQVAHKINSHRGVEAMRSFPISYSPARQEIRILKVRISKPDGSVVASYSENDRNINEPWTGMYYDARAKILSFPNLASGDILEVDYRLDDTALDNLLSDYWGDVSYPQSAHPKLRYEYIVDMPVKRTLYWNKSSLPAPIKMVAEEQKDHRMLYRFSAENLPGVIAEPSMPGWSEIVTPLHVSTYQTWDQVGKYYWGLIRDQLTPNEEIRRTVDKVLKGVDRHDELAVIRALYNFVVTNTRYVALEFGIHGYKPYRVDRILARRFGDCKDKASLIHSLLKVAGIESRLVLLRMRNLGAIGSEPASLAAFNHAIAYIPKYDLYLDGTAEFHGARELPSADRVANALIVNPDGSSTFVTTPESKPEDNTSRLSFQVTLKSNGSAQVRGESVITGQGAPEYRRGYQAAATRKATFEQGWARSFPGLSVKRVSLSDLTQLDKEVSLQYELDIPRYSEVLASGLRFYPFGSNRIYTETYAPLAERHYDLVLSSPWDNRYSFTYALPAGYSLTQVPVDFVEEGPFGKLRMHFKASEGKLSCEAEVTMSVARVRAKDYAAFRAFLGRVDQAFSRKILLTGLAGQTASRNAPDKVRALLAE